MATSVPDLSTLSKEEVTSIFSSIDTVLVDCDGVLWLGSRPLPGSLETIKKLRDLGKKIFIVSNNTTLTLEQYVEKFASLGLQVEKDIIIIPSVVVAAYLRSKGIEKTYLIGSEAFKQTVREEGMQFIENNGKLKEETLRGLISNLQSLDLTAGAVVMDFDPKLNYIMIMNAVSLLRQTNVPFLVGGNDYEVPISKDISIIGPGHFISMIENTTNRKAIVTGKPSRIVVDVISQRHPIVPERTLMIGDSLSQDILMGNTCGLQTLLVLSGVSKLEDISHNIDNKPKFCIPKLGDLLPFLQ